MNKDLCFAQHYSNAAKAMSSDINNSQQSEAPFINIG